jgi:hypothetical protein
LRFLLERLGPNWRVIASDVAEGSAGNGERLAFLYDSDRVQPSGLVGEIVLFYDQIAWFSEPDGTPLLDGIAYNQRAGSFDFIPHVLTGLTKNEISWRISDHYPLWAEFRLGEVWTGLRGIPAHWKQPPARDMLRFESGFPRG